jgi:hypothetical protein
MRPKKDAPAIPETRIGHVLERDKQDQTATNSKPKAMR